MNQHEWVKQCLERYAEEGAYPGDGSRWEKAHYPAPKKLGEETIDLKFDDHQVQGILQSEEYGRLCFWTSDAKRFLLTGPFVDGWFGLWNIWEKWTALNCERNRVVGIMNMTPEERSARAKKSAASMTPEKRSAAAKKGHGSLTPEQRSARAKKGHDSLTPEQRSARSRKGVESMTPEQRSARSAKSAASMTQEQHSAAGKKGADSLTPEQRSARAKRGHESLTPEQRSARSKKAAESATPEQRSARAKKGRESLTPEQRSEAARKSAASKTPEQRLAASKKANSQKWISTADGFVSLPGAVVAHNKSVGASASRRIPLSDQQYEEVKDLSPLQRLLALGMLD